VAEPAAPSGGVTRTAGCVSSEGVAWSSGVADASRLQAGKIVVVAMDLASENGRTLVVWHFRSRRVGVQRTREPPLHSPEGRRPAPSSPIKPRTVWYSLAGCLVAISAYLFFLGLIASYNSVSASGSYSLQRASCQSVYGWLRNEGGHLSAVQTEPTPDPQASLACHAAIGDREATIEVLLGFALAFTVVGLRTGQGEERKTHLPDGR
jgi:hypothetical protein